jgi:hypothetical protein
MSTLLSVAFYVAACSSIAGGLDFLLTASQRKALDGWLEDATLWCHYQRPIRWVLGTSQDGRGVVILGIGVASGAVGVIETLAFKSHMHHPMVADDIDGVFFSLTLLPLALYAWCLLGRYAWRFHRQFGPWIGPLVVFCSSTSAGLSCGPCSPGRSSELWTTRHNPVIPFCGAVSTWCSASPPYWRGL